MLFDGILSVCIGESQKSAKITGLLTVISHKVLVLTEVVKEWLFQGARTGPRYHSLPLDL